MLIFVNFWLEQSVVCNIKGKQQMEREVKQQANIKWTFVKSVRKMEQILMGYLIKLKRKY